MTDNNVIDFKSRKAIAAGVPANVADYQDIPAANRDVAYRVEFFDDEAFPMRFGGAKTTSQMRDLARRCMDAAFGLLAIAHERDQDDSQLLRMMAYVMHDGSVFVDTYEPPGFDGARMQQSFAWYLGTLPEIRNTLERMMREI